MSIIYKLSIPLVADDAVGTTLEVLEPDPAITPGVFVDAASVRVIIHCDSR